MHLASHCWHRLLATGKGNARRLFHAGEAARPSCKHSGSQDTHKRTSIGRFPVLSCSAAFPLSSLYTLPSAAVVVRLPMECARITSCQCLLSAYNSRYRP